MTKAPTPTEKSKKQRDTIKRHQNFDYTAIADRPRAVSWSNSSHQRERNDHWSLWYICCLIIDLNYM